jgi:ribosomal protein L37AE/L43A
VRIPKNLVISLTLCRPAIRQKDTDVSQIEVLLLKCPKPDGSLEEVEVREEDGIWKCPLCPKAYQGGKGNLNRHFKTKHPSNTEVPDFEEVESALSRIGCRFEPFYSLVICQHPKCEQAVDPKTIEAHATTHDLELLPQECSAILSLHRPVDRARFSELHSGVIAPVPGLAVIPDGYLCGVKGCFNARRDFKGLQSHCKSDHKDESLADCHTRGPFQAVFARGAGNWRVSVPEDHDEVQQRKSAFMASIPPPVPQDFSQTPDAGIHPFLRTTRWHEWLGTLPMDTEAFAAIAHPKRSTLTEAQVYLREAVRDYFESLVPVLRSAAHHPRKIISTKQ